MKNFEHRLTELEDLGAQIRSGEIGLEESLKKFERGIRLSRELHDELAKAEQRIEILTNEPQSPEDEQKLELFDK